MHTGGGTDNSTVGVTVGVAAALEELKSRGSALLVVGSVPEEAYAEVSACLLGSDSETNRRRLLVEDGTTHDSRYESIDRWTPEWTRILQFDVVARGTAASKQSGSLVQDSPFVTAADTLSKSSPRTARMSNPRLGNDGGSPEAATRLVSGSIVDLGVEIGRTIQEFDDIAGDLDPAELRVGFDCLTTLLAEYDEATVFRFLHLFTNDVKTASGMAHVRLPKPLDSGVVRLVRPLFDAVIELRLHGNEIQQRWHLRDADVVSSWLPVES